MPLDVDKELATLRGMTTSQLVERYAEVFGESVRSRHRDYLVRKIIWRMQANEEGDLSERARHYAGCLAQDADVRLMPPKGPDGRRLPTTPTRQAAPSLNLTPGTALVRAYKGKQLRIVVLDDGFEYDGKRYKSLSAVANAITGTHINGRQFFKVGGAA